MFLNNQVYISGIIAADLCIHARADNNGHFGMTIIKTEQQLSLEKRHIPIYIWSEPIIHKLKDILKKGTSIIVQGEIVTFGDDIMICVTTYTNIKLLQQVPGITFEEDKPCILTEDLILQAISLKEEFRR